MARVMVAGVASAVLAAAVAIAAWRFLVPDTAQPATSPPRRSPVLTWRPRRLPRSYGLMIKQRCR